MKPVLGPDFGAISLHSMIGKYKLAFHLFTVAFGVLAIWLAFAAFVFISLILTGKLFYPAATRRE
jgi:hypothetical protein